jgi:hypothetical protein
MAERKRIPVWQEDIPRATGVIPDPEGGEETECDCPRLDAADWHETESDWSDITFVRGAVSAVFGVPMNYVSVGAKLRVRAASLGATVPDDAMLLMGAGKFRRPVLLELEGVPRGARGIERPGGVVYSRLVPAPLGEMKKAVAETELKARVKYGRTPDATWLWYLTCKVCSRDRNFETLILVHYPA